MPYLAATELTARLPGGVTITGSTTPLTLGEVGAIIAEKSSEFDGYAAGAGFALPIATGASAYPMIQAIVYQGAAAQVLDTLFPNVGGGKTTTADQYRKAWSDAIKLLTDRKLVLPGVGLDSGETGRALPRSFATTDPSADEAAFAASPMVSMAWTP